MIGTACFLNTTVADDAPDGLIRPAAFTAQKTSESSASESNAIRVVANPTALETQSDDRPSTSEGKTAKVQPSDQRLKSIEAKLDELTKQLNALNTSGGATTADDHKTQVATSDDATEKSESSKSEVTKPQKPVVAKRGQLPAKTTLDDKWLSKIPARSLGPANMSGRISDIAIHPKDPSL